MTANYQYPQWQQQQQVTETKQKPRLCENQPTSKKVEEEE